MPEIGRWRNYTFEVSPTLILGFTGLTLKGSTETEEKTSDGQKYVSRKAGKPIESTFTIKLTAQTGCKVREDALALVQDATNSEKGYFYVGGKKLIPAQLMLVEAEVSEISIGPGGQWISCDVGVTMKQCTKADNNAAPSQSTGTKKTSVTTKPYVGKGFGVSLSYVPTTPVTIPANSLFGPYVGSDEDSGTVFQKAVDTVNNTINAAKAASRSTIGTLAKEKLLQLTK